MHANCAHPRSRVNRSIALCCCPHSRHLTTLLTPQNVVRVVPVSVLPARLRDVNMFIAVIPGSPSQQSVVDAFVGHVTSQYTGLNFSTFGGGIFSSLPYGLNNMTIPTLASVLRTDFASESALEDYVRQNGYGIDPAIATCFAAIVFNSGAPKWDYAIRMNSTRSVSQALRSWSPVTCILNPLACIC